MNAPRRGIGHAHATTEVTEPRRRAPVSVSRPPSAPTLASRAPAPVAAPAKATRSAHDVAHAFASGKVTLGHALGFTAAQKDTLKRRAFALVQEGKPDLAIPLLEGLVALDPFDAWTLIALGGLLVDKGDHVVAAALLTRALSVSPGDVTAHALRAEARVKQGDTAGARDDLAAVAHADVAVPAVRRARALELALSRL